VLGGFSTGGILALLASARKNSSQIKGVFSINAPIKLIQTKSKFVPAINRWNEFLSKMKIKHDTKESFVDNNPENPQINYHQNPLKGVEELLQLMRECQDNLHKITIPSLVLQGKDDPVVHPESADIIMELIGTPNKYLEVIPSDRHGIIRGLELESVGQHIDTFVRRVTS